MRHESLLVAPAGRENAPDLHLRDGSCDATFLAGEESPHTAVANSPTASEWDDHWRRQRTSVFGTLCSWYPRHIRARSVAYYFERYFPPTGVFAECGSGSSETSCRIQVRQRKLIAVDFSEEARARAARIPQIAECIRADIRELPFADNSLDGI